MDSFSRQDVKEDGNRHEADPTDLNQHQQDPLAPQVVMIGYGQGPVTQTADVAVNSASKKLVPSPLWVTAGSISKPVPANISKTKTSVTICGIKKRCDASFFFKRFLFFIFISFDLLQKPMS